MKVEKKNNDLPWKTSPRPLGAVLFYCFSLSVAAPPALSGFALLITISQPPLLFGSAQGAWGHGCKGGAQSSCFCHQQVPEPPAALVGT